MALSKPAVQGCEVLGRLAIWFAECFILNIDHEQELISAAKKGETAKLRDVLRRFPKSLGGRHKVS